MKKILFAGGGSGGHIFPIIAISRELRRIRPEEDWQFLYLGPRDDFSSISLSQEGFQVKTLLAGKLRRYASLLSILQNIVDILIKAPIGFLQAFGYIFVISPDIVFSKGGYGAFATGICSWLFQIPLLLHEADIAPGLSNRLLARLAAKVFISFPKTEYFSETSDKKTILSGNPIRRELLSGSKEEAKLLLRFTGEKPAVLVLGGSQGAQRINDIILAILPELLNDFELLHQTGEKNFNQVEAEAETIISPAQKRYYHPVPFLRENELKHAYSFCDLVVSRAGSGIIFEIAALQKPSILLPLAESAQNHQVKNAYAYAGEGAAMVMEEANLTPHFFLEKLRFLFSHASEMEGMKNAALKFANPGAAIKIAQYLADCLK